MLDIESLIEDAVKQFTAVVRGNNQHAFVSIAVPVSSAVNLFPCRIIDHAYWSRPHEQYSATALGQILYLTAEGISRFKSLQNSYLDYCYQWNEEPVAYMAFAFDAKDEMSDEWAAFPNAFLCVPRLLIESRQESHIINFNFEVAVDLQQQIDRFRCLLKNYSENPPSDKDKDNRVICPTEDIGNKKHWFDVAEKAITAIRQQKFRKLVLSRRCLCKSKPSFNTRVLLSTLADRYPDCTIISYVDSGSQFIAVSPERLLSLKAGYLQSDAIGGTLSEKEVRKINDEAYDPSVLSPKLLEEHAIIVEDICRRLEPLCESLSLPSSPQLKKLHNIYHLETPVKGRLASHQTVLSLTEQLHPTPAVAGFPGVESVNWLRENEKHRRGWYAGAFGLMRGDQNGEVSVLLRCALVDQTQVNVYAGAGLVAESDAEMEWQEIELKMNTILNLL